jgi:hypothetical protein
MSVRAYIVALALAGYTLATALAPHAATPAPLLVTLTLDGSPRTCPAQSFAYERTQGVSTLVIKGMACAVDRVFRSNFEVTTL